MFKAILKFLGFIDEAPRANIPAHRSRYWAHRTAEQSRLWMGER